MDYREFMIRSAKEAMDLFAPDEDFPKIALVLFADGWATMHEVKLKSKQKLIGGEEANSALYDTYAPAQIGEFNGSYVSRVFNALKKHPDGEITEIAAIPYSDGRLKEALSVGEDKGPHKEHVHEYRIVKFGNNRIIKVYTPPKVMEESEKIH